jgi:energy-coupling factor transporter ATP-binding protein EcfA2
MLERIEIENLGSIRKTGVSLGPLTVLVGANASGKTTVMRGMELFAALRSTLLSEVTFAGHSLNGVNWPTLLHGGDSARNLIFRAFVQRGSTEPDLVMQLGINWERVSEHIMVPTGAGPIEPEFLAERLRSPDGSRIEVGADEYELHGIAIPAMAPRPISVALMVSRLSMVPRFSGRLKALSDFVESFGVARYFRPNGAAMLTTVANGNVLPAGEGFVAALAALQNRESERFEAIEKRLRALFPHIQRIRFDVEGNARRLVFETSRSTRLTPAQLEADGVLTTLFLLWAGATTPPHGTLLLDEPEAALHPHLMGQRVEFLRSLANGEFTGHPLRVVVATQSVDFVQWLDTSEIRVVEYGAETGTLVHSLPESETLGELVDKFQTKLGDLWYSGTIGGIPGTGA